MAAAVQPNSLGNSQKTFNKSSRNKWPLHPVLWSPYLFEFGLVPKLREGVRAVVPLPLLPLLLLLLLLLSGGGGGLLVLVRLRRRGSGLLGARSLGSPRTGGLKNKAVM